MKRAVSRLILFLGFSFIIVKAVEGNAYATVQKVIKVEGDGVEKIIKVGDRDRVKIVGKNNKVTVEGSFATLEIEGTNHVVIVSKVKNIDIEGINNVVKSVVVDQVEIEGKMNYVYYKNSSNQNGKAKVDTQGTDNWVKKTN